MHAIVGRVCMRYARECVVYMRCICSTKHSKPAVRVCVLSVIVCLCVRVWYMWGEDRTLNTRDAVRAVRWWSQITVLAEWKKNKQYFLNTLHDGKCLQIWLKYYFLNKFKIVNILNLKKETKNIITVVKELKRQKKWFVIVTAVK